MEAGGVFVASGSEANFTGLAVARNARAEVDMKTVGVQGAPRMMTLYCSDEAHHCMDRSVELLGLGNEALRWVETDDDCRMKLDALQAAIDEDRAQGYHPFCVVGTAGTVNCGAFDDLNGLADLCAREGLWFHVDGAFGSWVKITETHRHLADGLERADSVAVDLHKWMSMPYGIGCTLVRDRLAHFSTFVYGHEAEYLKTGQEMSGDRVTNPMNLSLALSRPDYGLKAYMLLRAYGRDRYARLVQQNIDQIGYLAERIRRAPDMEVAAPVASNVLCFRYVREGLSEEELEELNRAILMELWEVNARMFNDTRIKGRHTLRLCNVNHRTRYSDFDLLAERVSRIGGRLAEEYTAS
jgi:glutamate/tyrosine decarboxylase-like PLP-dependent enzyme